jgi:SAM-dependent methyltransferase
MSRSSQTYRRPAWRLPPGVAPGTWEYTQRESIANEYSEFLKNTPLISLDLEITQQSLPPAKPDRATRVIDLGCGDGRALRMLWQDGYEVLGVDMSQPMLDRVSADAESQHLRAKLVRANLVQLDAFQDEVAHHAICLFSTIGMIHGRENRRAFMTHVARMLKPGGTFVLHVHNRNDAWRDRPSAAAYLRSAWQSFRSRENELGDRTYSYRGLADMFLHTYSLAELKADLRATGWRCESMVALSPRSDARLSNPNWLPSLRAGGFIAISTCLK